MSSRKDPAQAQINRQTDNYSSMILLKENKKKERASRGEQQRLRHSRGDVKKKTISIVH